MNSTFTTIVIVLLVLAALQLFGGLGSQLISFMGIVLLVGAVVLVIMWLTAFQRRASGRYRNGEKRRRFRVEEEVEEEPMDEEEEED